MDTESQKKLQSLVAKEPTGLSESDIAFLRARVSYLSPDHKIIFADVLGLNVKPAEPNTEEKAETKYPIKPKQQAKKPIKTAEPNTEKNK